MSKPEPVAAPVLSRRRLFSEIFIRRGVAWVLVVYNGLQLVYNLVAWFLSPESQAEWQLVKILKYSTWSNWALGLLLVLLGVVFEGAFRVIQGRERAFSDTVGGFTNRLAAVESELAVERTQADLDGQIHQVYVDSVTMDDDGVYFPVTIQASLWNTRNTVVSIRSLCLAVDFKTVNYYGKQSQCLNYAYFEDANELNGFSPLIVRLETEEMPLHPSQGYQRGVPQSRKWLRFRVDLPDLQAAWTLGSPLDAAIEKIVLIAKDTQGARHTIFGLPPWVKRGRVDFAPIDDSHTTRIMAFHHLKELHATGYRYFEEAQRGGKIRAEPDIQKWVDSVSDVIGRLNRVWEVEFNSCVDRLPFDEKYASSVSHRRRCAFLHPRLEKILEYMKELEREKKS